MTIKSGSTTTAFFEAKNTEKKYTKIPNRDSKKLNASYVKMRKFRSRPA